MPSEKFIDYIKTHSHKQFSSEIQDLKCKLLKMVDQAQDLQKKIIEIQIGLLDAVFRPDNQKRKNKVLQLLSSIIKKAFALGNFLKKNILKITQEQYENMRKACSTTFMMKSVQNMWNTAGTIMGLILSLIGFLFDPVLGAIVVTIWFGVVGVILKGLAVHQRYQKLENLIKQLTPIEKKISDAFREIEK